MKVSANRPDVSGGPDGLTPRELKVLRLVAAGHSNREVANALILSVRTVERHLATLYSKIGARGKADATAYAFRHSLTRATWGRKPSPKHERPESRTPAAARPCGRRSRNDLLDGLIRLTAVAAFNCRNDASPCASGVDWSTLPGRSFQSRWSRSRTVRRLSSP